MRGFILIGFGILYLMKPDIFRNGIWTKYSMHANKTLEEHRNYTKKVAIVLIVLGIAILAYDYRQIFTQKSANTSQISTSPKFLVNNPPKEDFSLSSLLIKQVPSNERIN